MPQRIINLLLSYPLLGKKKPPPVYIYIFFPQKRLIQIHPDSWEPVFKKPVDKNNGRKKGKEDIVILGNCYVG